MTKSQPLNEEEKTAGKNLVRFKEYSITILNTW
jgi:hypothetical protein